MILGHDRHKLYGNGKSWEKSDIERLLRKLVYDDYLQEELYQNNESSCLYMAIGRKAEEFMKSDNIKVFLNLLHIRKLLFIIF